MTSPLFDTRYESDEKLQHGESVENNLTSRVNTKLESTSAGEIVVVEPSFDESDGRGPSVNRKLIGMDNRSSPSSQNELREKRGHTRNLSEHFYDATTLTSDPRGPTSSPSYSPAVGQKHRRGLSGDGSNPPEAHRRINSIGNSASVRRQDYRQGRQHQRVDSALDILTAAADVSREELAMAAGERVSGVRVRGERNPWDPPSTGTSRRSPTQMVSYDHGVRPPPPPPPRGQHLSYPSGPTPPPYYGPPPPAPYHQHHYPPHPPYYPHPSHSYPRHIPLPPRSSGYPIQYSRGHDPYSKSHHSQLPRQQPALERPGHEPVSAEPSQTIEYNHLKSPQEKTRNTENVMTPPPPVTSSPHWQGGTTQGVQTFVTAIGVGDGGRTMHSSEPHRLKGSNPEDRETSVPAGHHRKTSSLSSLVFLGESADQMANGHHRSTLSSVSFLQGLEVGLEGDAAFLQHLQASTGTTASGYSTKQVARETKASTQRPILAKENAEIDPKSKLAPGGTSKRVRRKCTMNGCPNRVVQGGLCISHGAKRKQCKHPGCTKNVKKAGLCSTHGPARKRCEYESCGKVAVQGGRCIAHGAKKKLCLIDSCSKQAILGGMCKKHHDQNQNQASRTTSPLGESFVQCTVIKTGAPSGLPHSRKQSGQSQKPTHTRGLSIFQEMSADTVGTFLLANPEEESNEPEVSPIRREGSSYNREYGIY